MERFPQQTPSIEATDVIKRGKLLSHFCRRRLQFCSWQQPYESKNMRSTEAYHFNWVWTQPMYTGLERSLWRNPMLRLVSELVPHYSQCVLILCMSVERSIVVCHAASAARLLSKKRLILCYTLIVLILLVVNGSVFTLLHPGFTPRFYLDYVFLAPFYAGTQFLRVDSIEKVINLKVF